MEDYEKEQALRDSFNEMLDECHQPYTIGLLTYTASQILEAVDPIAYRIGLVEHEDYLAQ